MQTMNKRRLNKLTPVVNKIILFVRPENAGISVPEHCMMKVILAGPFDKY